MFFLFSFFFLNLFSMKDTSITTLYLCGRKKKAVQGHPEFACYLRHWIRRHSLEFLVSPKVSRLLVGWWEGVHMPWTLRRWSRNGHQLHALQLTAIFLWSSEKGKCFLSVSQELICTWHAKRPNFNWMAISRTTFSSPFTGILCIPACPSWLPLRAFLADVRN